MVCFSGAIFNFSHFDENSKGRAIFESDSIPRNLDESPFRDLYKKLGYQESIRSMLSIQSANLTVGRQGIWPEFEVDIPRRYEHIFVVQLRSGLNDTAIPAPRIDIEKEEFSFEWKGMVTNFFRQRLATAKVETW